MTENGVKRLSYVVLLVCSYIIALLDMISDAWFPSLISVNISGS